MKHQHTLLACFVAYALLGCATTRSPVLAADIARHQHTLNDPVESDAYANAQARCDANQREQLADETANIRRNRIFGAILTGVGVASTATVGLYGSVVPSPDPLVIGLFSLLAGLSGAGAPAFVYFGGDVNAEEARRRLDSIRVSSEAAMRSATEAHEADQAHQNAIQAHATARAATAAAVANGPPAVAATDAARNSLITLATGQPRPQDPVVRLSVTALLAAHQTQLDRARDVSTAQTAEATANATVSRERQARAAAIRALRSAVNGLNRTCP